MITQTIPTLIRPTTTQGQGRGRPRNDDDYYHYCHHFWSELPLRLRLRQHLGLTIYISVPLRTPTVACLGNEWRAHTATAGRQMKVRKGDYGSGRQCSETNDGGQKERTTIRKLISFFAEKLHCKSLVLPHNMNFYLLIISSFPESPFLLHRSMPPPGGKPFQWCSLDSQLRSQSLLTTVV